jgi:hypothetical protein
MTCAPAALRLDELFRAISREMIYQQHPLTPMESDPRVASDDTQEITQ